MAIGQYRLVRWLRERLATLLGQALLESRVLLSMRLDMGETWTKTTGTKSSVPEIPCVWLQRSSARLRREEWYGLIDC